MIFEAGTEPKLHDITWACEDITSLAHLSALLTALTHLVVNRGCLRAKIRVSELEVRYTVPEVNAPFLPKEWNLECDAQVYLYGIPDRLGT